MDHKLEDIILYRYISPEYVPVQYRGLSRENDIEFSATDGGVSELFIKPGVKQIVDIPAIEVRFCCICFFNNECKTLK